jgi:hypothetical protein
MIACQGREMYDSSMADANKMDNQKADDRTLRELRSVGPAMVEDFQKLGITSVAQLKSKNAQKLYDQLCKIAGQRMDPCVLDVFECAIAQAKDPGLPAEQCDWWYWSKVRKQRKR